MTILQRSLLLVGLLSWSLCSFAQPLETASSNAAAEEWVVVFDDPRPARLKGWSRGGYTKRGNYAMILISKISGLLRALMFIVWWLSSTAIKTKR